MHSDDEDKTLEITDGTRKLKVRGYDILTIVVCICGTLLLYIMWQHMEDTKDLNAETIRAMAKAEAAQHQTNLDMSRAITSLAASQREMACIISLPQDKRLEEFTKHNGLCKRLSMQ